MLRVVEFGEVDQFGNAAPDGGALIVGVKFTMAVWPVHEETEDGFVPWMWSVRASGVRPEMGWEMNARDTALVDAEQLHSKAMLLCVSDVVKQLHIDAVGKHQRKINAERANPVKPEDVMDTGRDYFGVRRAEELAEWAEGVQHYLWYQRWLVGYV